MNDRALYQAVRQTQDELRSLSDMRRLVRYTGAHITMGEFRKLRQLKRAIARGEVGE